MSAGHFSEFLPHCGSLISGTGWASAFEHDARKLAKQLGRRSIAVIDHWTNYRARFVRNGVEVLPDEIWVTDEYAKNLAEMEFPTIRIVQLQNAYLENLVGEVRGHDYNKNVSLEENILYVLEPIRQAWGTSELPGDSKRWTSLSWSWKQLVWMTPRQSDYALIRRMPWENMTHGLQRERG